MEARDDIANRRADPGYLALRAAGFRFENGGAMLGDRRTGATCWYAVYAPDGALLGHRRGMSAAYAVALGHFRRERSSSLNERTDPWRGSA
jgi:hypothetical protein